MNNPALQRVNNVTYRILHDLCIQCGNPLDNAESLYCTSCMSANESVPDAGTRRDKAENLNRNKIAARKKHPAQPKIGKSPVDTSDRRASSCNPQTNRQPACPNAACGANYGGAKRTYDPDKQPTPLCDHACKCCVWGKWEGNTMFCPFPNCIRNNAVSAESEKRSENKVVSA